MTRFYRQPPYVTIYRNQNQEFIYFGSMHTHDIDHPQLGIIKLYWDKWLETKSETQEKIALIEGGSFEPPASKKVAVEENGERGWLAWLAKQDDVACQSPEPDYKVEMEHMLEKFSTEEVLHYYFIRSVVQWHRLDPRPSMEEYFDFIPRVPERYGLENYELDLDKLKQIHHTVTGRELDLEDLTYLRDIVDPYQDKVITNQVSLYNMRFRDQHIVNVITEHFRSGQSIFAVFGHSHVEEQEDKLRELL